MVSLISTLVSSSDMGVWILLVCYLMFYAVACLRVCSSVCLNLALKALAFFPDFYFLVADRAFNFPPPLSPVTNLLFTHYSLNYVVVCMGLNQKAVISSSLDAS